MSGNQSKETQRQMKRLYNDLDDSRRPLIRQGVDNFANKVGMADENRQKLHEVVDIVPAADFKSAIQRCIDWFLDRFKEFEARMGRRPVFSIGRFFAFQTSLPKSSDWLEHKLIEALGSPLFYVNENKKEMLKRLQQYFSANSPLPDFVVFLDDAVYSGWQLGDWVKDVGGILRRFFRKDAPALLIATAYATPEGAERVREGMLDSKDKFFHAKTLRSTPQLGLGLQWIQKYDLNLNLNPTMTVMPHKSPNGASMGLETRNGQTQMSNSIRTRTGEGIYKLPTIAMMCGMVKRTRPSAEIRAVVDPMVQGYAIARYLHGMGYHKLDGQHKHEALRRVDILLRMVEDRNDLLHVDYVKGAKMKLERWKARMLKRFPDNRWDPVMFHAALELEDIEGDVLDYRSFQTHTQRWSLLFLEAGDGEIWHHIDIHNPNEAKSNSGVLFRVPPGMATPVWRPRYGDPGMATNFERFTQVAADFIYLENNKRYFPGLRYKLHELHDLLRACTKN
jgi:truncated hemoglobin YjbI